MKNIAKVLHVTGIILSLAFLASCDDEKPANRITVNGDGYKFSQAYVVSQGATRNEVAGYAHIIYLTGDGLTIDAEAVDFEGEGNVAIFYILSKDAELKAGTYTLVDSEDADFGDAATFVVATSFNGTNYDDAFTATSGNINVSKSGSKYTFKFNFNEYLLGTSSESEVGEGSIKGSYTGKVEVLEINTDATRVRENFNPFKLQD